MNSLFKKSAAPKLFKKAGLGPKFFRQLPGNIKKGAAEFSKSAGETAKIVRALEKNVPGGAALAPIAAGVETAQRLSRDVSKLRGNPEQVIGKVGAMTKDIKFS